MPNGHGSIRYAYLKNGDALEQFVRINAQSATMTTGGPDAFLSDFLRIAQPHPVLLLSWSNRIATHRSKDLTVHVFKNSSGLLKPFGTIIVRVVSALRTWILLSKFRPTRVLCGSIGMPLWVCFMYARVHAIPFVHSLHNRIEFNQGGFLKAYAARINKWILRNSAGLICHGPYLRQQLIEIGVPESRITEFDSGSRDILSDTPHHDDATDLTDGGRREVILFIGRVDKDKGVFDLLEAFAEIAKKIPHSQLVYVGAGPALEPLRHATERLGLKHRIVFLGYIAHEKLGPLIRQAKVIVTPTKSHFPEGRCMAAMEGLALGIPVIAPNFGPFPYLVKDGLNGLLFTPDSVPDLHDKLYRLLSDTSLFNDLKQGALTSCNNLLDAHCGFAEAASKAFQIAEHAYPANGCPTLSNDSNT